MTRMYIMVGLPGSGKTQLSQRMLNDSPLGTVARVSRDGYRRMCLPDSYGAPIAEIEGIISVMQHDAIRCLLENRIDVIVDDTNLNPKHQQMLTSVAIRYGADPTRVLLLDVPVETCIARDSKRIGVDQVGREVILDMHQRWIATERAWRGA